MKKEIKKLWINALISGEYKQGEKALRSKDKFCCLGVLCDLHRKHTKNGRWVKNTDNDIYSYIVNHEKELITSHASLLPKKVQQWAGVNSQTVMIKNGRSLLYLNDTGHTFKQIAEKIEKYL